MRHWAPDDTLLRDVVLFAQPRPEVSRLPLLGVLIGTAHIATVLDADECLVVAPVAGVPADVEVSETLVQYPLSAAV